MNELFEKIGISQNVALIGIGVILGGTLWYFVMIKGQVNKIESLNREYTQVRQKIKEAQASTGDVSAMTSEVKKLQGQKDRLTAKVPGAREMSDILQHIASKAERNNIAIQSMDPATDKLFSKASKSSYYVRVPIDLQMYGQFMDFGQFIEQLQDFPFYMSIENLQLSYDDTHFPRLKIDLEALVVVEQQKDRESKQNLTAR